MTPSVITVSPMVKSVLASIVVPTMEANFDAPAATSKA